MAHSETVLLVEDNEDDVFFFRRAYKEAALGAALRIVSNGQEAIDYLNGKGEFSDRDRSPFPSAIFLDLKMPKLNGFEVLSWIRQTKHLSLPVAILSSSAEDADIRRGRELGADTYLIKPPTKSMLLECWKLFKLGDGKASSEPIQQTC